MNKNHRGKVCDDREVSLSTDMWVIIFSSEVKHRDTERQINGEEWDCSIE